nr:MAG TPA: ParB protein [Caudoviricetes sp.]
MNIVEKNINDIKPYENNPRKNDVAVKPVANSIREFGFKVPIVIDKDGIIIAGHTRYRAAKELKLTKVPCIIADDLSDQQVKAFRLADNKVSEFAEWDQDALFEELQGILAVDMSEFGFLDEEEELSEPDDTYTTDINIPQYEPTGEVVSLENCLDDDKTQSLLMEIEDSNVTEKEKDFLRKAAQRHNQFNYKRIAEYYANASEEMQELMERSALVIIDYDDAIKNGYVQLSSSLESILGDENGE